MPRLTLAILSLLTIASGISSGQARGDDKPAHTIKQAMKEHKKGGLKDKVIEGTASDADKKQLVELYVALGQNKPPKGSDESWKKLTDALINASRDVASGKENGVSDLKKAVNCGSCHSVHKAS